MKRSTVQIPSNVMHEPTTMTWAQLSPTGEIKKLVQEKSLATLTTEGGKKNPMPLTKASTSLRRAFPFIFNSCAYSFTHNPEKVKEGEFYKSFSMPFSVFLEYCLDDCDEQRDYLKKELYHILSGEKSNVKYIRVSKDRIVLAQPIVIALSHTNLETGKDERIYNLGEDHKVDKIEIQILKELLTYEHGFLNVPKAFYAKTRRVYETMRKNVQPLIEKKDDYWGLINAVKDRVTDAIDTSKAARIGSKILAQANVLDEIEQGGYHKLYLASEYILVNKKRGAKRQDYDLLKLCSKCAPEYVQEKDDKFYFKDKTAAFRYALLIAAMVKMLDSISKEIIGIESIDASKSDEIIEVIFKKGG